MIIQHNISALNSYRNLSMNNNAISGNLEKLSSGYAINRAGDDAAGLAISEKMRAQITGLETAQANAEDGISLVQTAEGALTEVHTMLNRMVELAQQSSNGTIQDEVDRENIQEEVEALKSEIDRISESTNFNGINLLDGSLSSEVTTSGASSVAMNGNALAGTDGVAYEQTFEIASNASGDNTLEMTYLDKDGKAQQIEISFTTQADAIAQLKDIFGPEYSIEGTNNANTVTITSLVKQDDKTQILAGNVDGTDINVGTVTAGVSDVYEINMTDTIDATSDISFTIDGKTFVVMTGGNDAELADGEIGIRVDQSTGALNADSVASIVNQLKEYGIDASVDSTTGTYINIAKADTLSNDDDTAQAGGLELQIGDTSDSFNQIKVSVDAMDTESLGIANINLGTQDGAQEAVDIIKKAINTVSSTRGNLGAIQNRLEHTINNLGVTAENMTAAESRIRDVDMAKEMMEYTKNNILIQSSQAMLAQANQLPQGVLQLLQ